MAAEVDVKVRANNKSQTTSQRNLTNRLGTPHLSQISEENHSANTGVLQFIMGAYLVACMGYTRERCWYGEVLSGVSREAGGW